MCSELADSMSKMGPALVEGRESWRTSRLHAVAESS